MILVRFDHFHVLTCRVSGVFQYMHFGNFTNGVDERGEVALLSHNILIEGVTEDDCYTTNHLDKKDDTMAKRLCKFYNEDTFGGHIRVSYSSQIFNLYLDFITAILEIYHYIISVFISFGQHNFLTAAIIVLGNIQQ